MQSILLDMGHENKSVGKIMYAKSCHISNIEETHVWKHGNKIYHNLFMMWVG